MGSHHHHDQHHYQNLQPTNYCCRCSCTSSHPSPLSHSPPQITDSLLLQAIANHLLQPPQTHLYPQHHQQPQQQQKHQHHQQQQQQHKHHQQQQLYNQHQQTQSLITSLHNRINTLESSLLHLSTSKPSPSPSPPPLSLRDIAARTIQTHFRTLLVRRSRTLRHLKDLAFIKSCLNGLKSSLSENTHINCEVLSQKAMDLLLKLDSIQGSDSMIRDGKRSISRELVRFLEFVDEVSVRRRDTSSKATRNLREKLSDQVQEIHSYVRVSEDDEESHVELEGFHHIDEDDEEIPINLNYGKKNEISQAKNGILVKRQFLHPKTKKNVRFAENGNISRVFVSTHEPFSNRDIGIDDPRVSSEDQRELVEHLCREVEEIGGFSRGSEDDEEEAHEEKRGPPPQLSDGGRNPRKIIKTQVNYGIGEHFQGQNGNFVFSAPEPVKMEPRQDDLKRKKTVRMTSF